MTFPGPIVLCEATEEQWMIQYSQKHTHKMTNRELIIQYNRILRTASIPFFLSAASATVVLTDIEIQIGCGRKNCKRFVCLRERGRERKTCKQLLKSSLKDEMMYFPIHLYIELQIDDWIDHLSKKVRSYQWNMTKKSKQRKDINSYHIYYFWQIPFYHIKEKPPPEHKDEWRTTSTRPQTKL